MSLTTNFFTLARGDVERALLDDTCVVKQRPALLGATTTDGAPDDADTAWTATTVACRVAPSGGNTAVIGMKREAEADKAVYVPVGTAVKPYDRIAYSGTTYEVIETSEPRTWSFIVRILVKVVT